MKTLLTRLTLLTCAMLTLAGCTGMLAARNPNPRIPLEIAGILASNRVSYVAGGESVQTAVTPEVLKALAEKANEPNEAAYFRYTQFGQDTAPDQPVVDSSALEAKNDLNGMVEKLMKSQSPEAAGALALAQQLKGSMDNWTKPIPQGDRSGGNQLVGFVGSSADAAQVAKNDADQIAAMRIRQFPRANAATTTTRTERNEWTEGALEIAGKYADRISSNYWAFTLAKQAEDEKEVVEGPDDPQTPTPVPVDDKGNVAPADRQGTQAFLWKPVSDSNGNLVVLLPAKFNGLIDSPATINGERGTYTSTANGNRAHFRFSKPGAAYGSNVAVTWGAGGKTFRVVVPNGGQRWQTDDVANPAVPTPVSNFPKPEDPMEHPAQPLPTTPDAGAGTPPGEPPAP